MLCILTRKHYHHREKNLNVTLVLAVDQGSHEKLQNILASGLARRTQQEVYYIDPNSQARAINHRSTVIRQRDGSNNGLNNSV